MVLLGLGLLFLSLFRGCLLLPDRRERERERENSENGGRAVGYDTFHEGVLGGYPSTVRLPTSLVLASPFSEWFSSLASASAFSFAFLVFLSSFLSFTAFSFCRGRGGGGPVGGGPAYMWGQAAVLPPLVYIRGRRTS